MKSKNRVGIITIHNSPNYGACLQSFALYKYIKLQGVDCEIIDLHRPHYQDFVPSRKFIPYRTDDRNIKGRIKRLAKSFLRFNKKTVYYSSSAKIKFDKFNSQIKLSCAYCGIDELYSNPPIYDLYVTGSDQLWNPAQPYCLEPYFLTFAPDGAKKISYAASIGITELKDEEKRDFKKWLASYDAIAVRELQAKTLIESFTKYEVTQVADPTFLLDVDYWQSMAIYPTVKRPYILLFTLQHNPDLLRFALRMSKESGFQLISLGQIQPDATDDSYISVTDAGPKEFLGYIADADLVITNSFHCTVFSIIMGAKNFYSYIVPGKKNGSRITDLLETYQLSEHLLDNNLNETYVQLEENKISREKVMTILNKEQSFSRAYLNSHLK